MRLKISKEEKEIFLRWKDKQPPPTIRNAWPLEMRRKYLLWSTRNQRKDLKVLKDYLIECKRALLRDNAISMQRVKIAKKYIEASRDDIILK